MTHISVAIPVYNRAHLVGRTIESVLAQTFHDWDLLIVDDGSTDDSVAVVNTYRDSRIHLERNPRNLGLTRNWNRCLELARGPLVQVLLSDDLIDSDYLQLVSDTFEQYPGVGMVAASCRYIDANDRVIHPGAPRSSHLFRAGDEAVATLLTGGYPHVSSIVFRRECYERLGKFDERIWHGPDMEMDARIASQYDYYRFGSVHTSFRRHGTNMGCLEYLREDFLTTDMFKRRKTWEYLSTESRQRLGIQDLEESLRQVVAQSAVAGAIVTIAYGRTELTHFYLRQAAKLDPGIWRSPAFWKAAALSLIPPLGQRVMGRRMNIETSEKNIVQSVEDSLHNLPKEIER